MIKNLLAKLNDFSGKFLDVREDFKGAIPRYNTLRRNLIILMVLVATIPLVLMAAINYFQYKETLKNEMINPLRTLTSKSKHSFELFLAERLSAISFIASAYPYTTLTNDEELNNIFRVLKQEFKGFIDLGLIDSSGLQVSYAGPYDLRGKDYYDQTWYQDVQVKGHYISDVFMGYRKFPHVAIAIQHTNEYGLTWVLRATIDTTMFSNLIASMGLDPESDAFLVNHSGIFQTNSKFYGKVLEKCPLKIEPVSYETNVLEQIDPLGRKIFLTYIYFVQPSFVLVVVKPQAHVLNAWYSFKSELLYIFIGSLLVIFFVVFKLTDILIKRIRESDEKRAAAFREVEHTQKLSSIGRLAAGVAHEINNPMAIINEKAGLMQDLLEYKDDFPDKAKFLSLVQAIQQSVERSRTITHRLLGLTRRREVKDEPVDINKTIAEVVAFVEREALYRDIQIQLNLYPELPRIVSDKGQLEQVFLNILNNAIEAMDNGGIVFVNTWEKDTDTIGVSFQDNGRGMSAGTLEKIFEPFFTTKKESGTGLGLSISYSIIKNLGGEISAKSIENEGTKFTIYLPKKSNGNSEGQTGEGSDNAKAESTSG